MKKNLLKEFDEITELWSPRIISEVNDVHVKLAKIKGDFDRHTHEDEDELFYIVKGNMSLIYDDDVIELNEGDIHVVKKGHPHKPVTKEECWVLLVENKSTKHTGEIVNQYTKTIKEQLKWLTEWLLAIQIAIIEISMSICMILIEFTADIIIMLHLLSTTIFKKIK